MLPKDKSDLDYDLFPERREQSELRLTLDKSLVKQQDKYNQTSSAIQETLDHSALGYQPNEILVGLTRIECIALHNLLKNEFISHEYYEEIHSIMNKLNDKLVR